MESFLATETGTARCLLRDHVSVALDLGGIVPFW
jgi:hypothetical protein